MWEVFGGAVGRGRIALQEPRETLEGGAHDGEASGAQEGDAEDTAPGEGFGSVC